MRRLKLRIWILLKWSDEIKILTRVIKLISKNIEKLNSRIQKVDPIIEFKL